MPWKDNKPNISCVPKGLYHCSVVYWKQHNKYVYMLNDVPSRYGILIHAANLMGSKDDGYKAQLQGCIALGESLGSIEGQKALLLSPPAVRNFMTQMNNKPFNLEIR